MSIIIKILKNTLVKKKSRENTLNVFMFDTKKIGGICMLLWMTPKSISYVLMPIFNLFTNFQKNSKNILFNKAL